MKSEFDAAGRLTRYGNPATLTMGYRGDGLRAWKENASGVRTYFVYDGAEPVAEVDESGNLKALNGFGFHGLSYRKEFAGGGSTTTYHFFDPQGTVSYRVLDDGTPVGADRYDAYGQVRATAQGSSPWGYKGQWGYYTDVETGLIHLTNLYYDPSTGRFLTRDPIGYGGGPNLYRYAINPVMFTDPLGLTGTLEVTREYVKGYGDAAQDLVNPMSYWNAANGLYRLTRDCGWGATGRALAQGVARSVTDLGSEDPRTAGKAMGNLLAAVATGGAAEKAVQAARAAGGARNAVRFAEVGRKGGSANFSNLSQSHGFQNQVTVLGHYPDTMVAKNWPGHNVLNLPDNIWTWDINKQWLQAAIDRGDTIYLASEVRPGPSILRQELEYLMASVTS